MLAAYTYDNQGRRTSLTRANGTSTSYGYDAMSRLQSLTENVGGTTHDNNVTFTYTPASEIKTVVRSNDIFAWPDAYDVSRTYTINGRNQVTSATTVGVPTPLSFSYDANGNLTGSGSTTYDYDSENRLTSASGTSCSTCTGTASLSYDPAGRLYQITGGGNTTRFAYEGGNIIAEYDGSNALLRRYVFGPGADEALVWYEGTGTSDRRFFHADERGSIVAVTDSSGAVTTSQSYDEYGIPAEGNTTRFQYTGQAWLPELGLYYYKARMYSPTMGRFLQTDPIGYSDGMNMYAYVRGDPVNYTDPSGLDGCSNMGLTTSASGYSYTAWVTTQTGPGTYVSEQVIIIVAPKCGQPIASVMNPSIITPGHSGGIVGSGSGSTKPKPQPRRFDCDAPLSSGVGSARGVLEVVATGADIATVGFTAGGITAPIAVATKLVGLGAEAALLGVNLYDGFANDNWGALHVQVAGAATRLVPGGRTLQSGLRAARGPTGILRNSRGQFRTSHINNPAVAEAGDLAIQQGAQAAEGAVVCR